MTLLRYRLDRAVNECFRNAVSQGRFVSGWRPLPALPGWLLGAAFCLVFTGCGSNSDLLEVGGKISLDGVPLKSGSIRLTLVGANRVFASAAPVTEGEYLFPQAKGLPAGTYHVVISAIDENSPMVIIKDAAGRPLTRAPAELIPAAYNANSEKTIDVAREGENRFDFEIAR